jgi:hypothetical protein
MCPRNSYVDGFQTKKSERDGIYALQLSCKTKITG